MCMQVARQERLPVRTGPAVGSQIWRNGPELANLARVPAGVETESIDGNVGRSVGEILALGGTPDVVGGHLGSIVRSGHAVLTSVATDVTEVPAARPVDATIRRI